MNRELTDSSEGEDKAIVKFASMTRTGFIPLCPETRFKKKQNQDASLVLQRYMGVQNNWIFGVFDGHGSNGGRFT